MDIFALLREYCKANALRYGEHVPLSGMCTFKIGGEAHFVAWPSRKEKIRELVCLLRREAVPYTVLGRGSNILCSDAGYGGAVLCLGNDFAGMNRLGGNKIFCESGAPLSQLCLFALEQGLSGLEFAYGIPGTVGGAVYMNAGAYGGEMRDVLVSCTHITPDGGEGMYGKEELGLSYRHSAYTDAGYIITGANFQLIPGDKADIKAKMDEYMSRRREKQPLEYPSAGSTFKRPEGNYASALIDSCGLKGLYVGGAAVSEKHAGFIVNMGGATCRDVLALIERVQKEVHEKTGYELQCEIKLLQ